MRAHRSLEMASTALVRNATFFLDRAKVDEALEGVRAAVRAAKAAPAPLLEMEAHHIEGEVQRERGDLAQAVAATDRALEVASSAERTSTRLRAEVLRSRGTLLRRLGRVDDAILAHQKALTIFRDVGARTHEARTRNALAYAYLVKGHYEESIAHAGNAVRIDLESGARMQVAKTLTNLGHAFARLGVSKRAGALLEQARQMHIRYSRRRRAFRHVACEC